VIYLTSSPQTHDPSPEIISPLNSKATTYFRNSSFDLKQFDLCNVIMSYAFNLIYISGFVILKFQFYLQL
jgi:hypothetical protein